MDDHARKLTTLGVATVLMALLGGCGGDAIGVCWKGLFMQMTAADAERHGCHPWRPVLTNYQDEQFDDAQIAIVKPGSWNSYEQWMDPSLPLIKRIRKEDGTSVYDAFKEGPVRTFKLTPGTYVIDYSREPKRGQVKPLPQRDSVQLRPGHTYLVTYVTCYFYVSRECRHLEGHPGVALFIKDETTDQVIGGDSVEAHALQLRVGDCVIRRGGKDQGTTPGRISEFVEKDGARHALVWWTDGRSPTEELPLMIKKWKVIAANSNKILGEDAVAGAKRGPADGCGP